jgi:hypothetical protein
VFSQTIVQQAERPTALKLLNPAALESPSLLTSAGADAAAYELKFLLTEAQAREVEDRVRGQLVLDAHADPSLGNAYRTTSLYCDTAQLDVFHRAGAFKRRKHRLRRYGRAPWVFLERKIKRGDRVRKRRTMVPDEDLGLLANPMSAVDWSGHWFHRHLLRRGLGPVCRITYERVALVGQGEDGPLRLTFDRRIRGVLTRAWDLEEFGGGLAVLPEAVICEFKYRAFLPALFKEVILALCLTPTLVSKYRAFLRTSPLSLPSPLGGEGLGVRGDGRTVDA